MPTKVLASLNTRYDRRHNGVDVEHDLLIVEAQHNKAPAHGTGVSAQITQSLFSTTMVSLAVALDDQSVSDKKVEPPIFREWNASLGADFNACHSQVRSQDAFGSRFGNARCECHHPTLRGRESHRQFLKLNPADRREPER